MKAAADDAPEDLKGTIYGDGGVMVTKSILMNNVNISISSNQNDENGFYLMNGDNKIYYQVISHDAYSEDENQKIEVHNGDVVLTQQAGARDADTYLKYIIDKENVAKIHYAGDYSAIVTFTAASDNPQ